MVSKWVLIMDSRTYVVGPFDWVCEAERYAEAMHLKPEQYIIREIIAPAG